MGLYLYCIGAADHPEPGGVAGIGGAAVRAMEVAGLRLWVSDLDREPTASLDHVRVHNAVVEAAAVERTPLPVRFGQWLAGREELVSLVEGRRNRLVGALERVAGAVEFGVRIVDPDQSEPEPPDRTSGKAYLESLARRGQGAQAALRRAEAVAEELTESLGSIIREHRIDPASPGLVRVAHLVARHDTGTYRETIRIFPERHRELHFTLSGPWPPYGFADDGV